MENSKENPKNIYQKMNQKKTNQKLNMTKLMRGLILIISFIGLAGIIYLIAVYSNISKNYSQIANEIYQDIEYMNALNENLYQHQNLVFEHIITSSETKKEEVEKESDIREKQLRQLLTLFGETTTGSKYESYYHNIYSGIVGYLKNVDIIYDFSKNGEIETAQYYMENVLEDYLVSVNENMKTLDDITKQDMQIAKDKMNENIETVGINSTVLLIVLIVFSILSQFIGYRVSDMMVNFDADTGIINYSNFLERLEKRQKNGSLVGYTVFAINIKGFQYINQRVGGENGEQVLRKFAQALSEKIEKNELVAKSSGDGFAVFIKNEKVEEFLTFLNNITLEIVLSAEEEEMESMRKIHIHVPSRCGYYSMEKDVSCLQALENAALALKIARNLSESDQICYEENMFVQTINQNQMIHEFRSGIDNKEFIVYYQPKVDICGNKLCGAEALARWIYDDRIIPPMQFIPALEKGGFMPVLDFYILEEVCKTIENLQEAGFNLVPISVNFSMANLRDEKFAEHIISVVESYKIDKKYIEIELKESSEYEDYNMLSVFAKKIKKANINISIDFGTKQASMTMLKDVHVDTIKLGRAFVEGIVDDRDNVEDEKLVSNIVRMVKDLNKNVICVGVETLKQVDFLKNAHCNQVQGYLFDRPLPIEEFTKKLNHPNY